MQLVENYAHARARYLQQWKYGMDKTKRYRTGNYWTDEIEVDDIKAIVTNHLTNVNGSYIFSLIRSTVLVALIDNVWHYCIGAVGPQWYQVPIASKDDSDEEA